MREITMIEQNVTVIAIDLEGNVIMNDHEENGISDDNGLTVIAIMSGHEVIANKIETVIGKKIGTKSEIVISKMGKRI
jgi:hypothetical protein